MPLSLAMDDSEFDIGGDGDVGGGGGPAAAAAGGSCGRQRRRGGWWRGRSVAVGAWQRSTATMDYGKVMAIGRCNSTVVVAGGDRD